MIKRRTLIKASLGGALCMVNARAFSTLITTNPQTCRVIYNPDLSAGKLIAEFAEKNNLDLADCNGEVVRFFYDNAKEWMNGRDTIVGVSNYADFMQASGVAREKNRCVAYAGMRHSSGDVTLLSADPAIYRQEGVEAMWRITHSAVRESYVLWCIA